MATSRVLNENNVSIWVVRGECLKHPPSYGLSFFFRKHGPPNVRDRHYTASMHLSTISTHYSPIWPGATTDRYQSLQA
jgi:hypothetical protein